MIDISTLLIVASGATFVAALVFLLLAYKKVAAASLLLNDSKDRLKNSKRDIDAEKQAALIKIKDEMYHKRKEFELDLKRERIEIDRLQTKLGTKSEHLEKRELQLDDLRIELQQKESVYTPIYPLRIFFAVNTFFSFIGLTKTISLFHRFESRTHSQPAENKF